MKRTVLTAALLGALLTGVPVSAAPPGALAGAGAGMPSGGLCGGTVAITVVGVNVVGDTWLFSGTAIINPAGPCVITVAHVTGTGTWRPSSGGCPSDAVGGSVCVGPVPQQLTPTTVRVDVCPAYLGGCVSGSATVLRI